jgi:hypothetical protein
MPWPAVSSTPLRLRRWPIRGRPAALDHGSKFGCCTGEPVFTCCRLRVCVGVIERCRRAGCTATVRVSRAAAVTYRREVAIDFFGRAVCRMAVPALLVDRPRREHRRHRLLPSDSDRPRRHGRIGAAERAGQRVEFRTKAAVLNARVTMRWGPTLAGPATILFPRRVVSAHHGTPFNGRPIGSSARSSATVSNKPVPYSRYSCE